MTSPAGPEIIRGLIEALTGAAEGVDAALSMVEQRGYIPNWDWLRELRQQSRAALAAAQRLDIERAFVATTSDKSMSILCVFIKDDK